MSLAIRRTLLLELDVEFAHEPDPVLELPADEAVELFRARADDLESGRAEFLPYVGFGKGCDEFAVQPRDHRRGRSRGREHSDPVLRLEPGKSGFRHSGAPRHPGPPRP